MLPAVILKSDEREEDEHFEDEDFYPDDCDEMDEFHEEGEQSDVQEKHLEQEQLPEDISSILNAHGGSINLREFTKNVRGNFLLINF